jgi:hypothetical protein
VSQLENKIARLLEENEQIRSRTEEPDEEPDIVSYIIRGTQNTPTQNVIESRTRIALRDEDSLVWMLYNKDTKVQALPLSDWEYENLLFSDIVERTESFAILWVGNESDWV